MIHHWYARGRVQCAHLGLTALHRGHCALSLKSFISCETASFQHWISTIDIWNSVVSTQTFQLFPRCSHIASNVRATPLRAPKESSKSTAKRPLAKPVWLIRKRRKIRYFFSSFSQEANRCFIITVTSIFYPDPEIQFSFFAFSERNRLLILTLTLTPILSLRVLSNQHSFNPDPSHFSFLVGEIEELIFT